MKDFDVSEIVVGEEYALRRAGNPERRIRVLAQLPRGKWEIEHLDSPDDGRRQIVVSRNIVCRWSDLRELLRAEERMAKLKAAGRELSDPRWIAVSLVVDAVRKLPDMAGFHCLLCDRHLRIYSDAVTVLSRLAGLDPATLDVDGLGSKEEEQEGAGYVWLLSFPSAERLARALAATQPDAVLHCVEQHEDIRWKDEYGRGEAPRGGVGKAMGGRVAAGPIGRSEQS